MLDIAFSDLIFELAISLDVGTRAGATVASLILCLWKLPAARQVAVMLGSCSRQLCQLAKTMRFYPSGASTAMLTVER